jgi:hypothetical protein
LQLIDTARTSLTGKNVTLAYAASVQAAALAALGRTNEARALEAAMRPPVQQSSLLERMVMSRALGVYTTWAPPDAAERFKADLTAAGFLPISSDSGAAR